MSATIHIEGLDRLVAKFGRIGTMDALEPAMHKAVKWIEAEIKPYPPKPAHSTYERTGKLGQGWTQTVTRAGDILTGKVGTNVSYAPLVQHDRRFPAPHQALVHKRTGWPTDVQVMEANRAVIVQEFKNAIRGALNE